MSDKDLNRQARKGRKGNSLTWGSLALFAVPFVPEFDRQLDFEKALLPVIVQKLVKMGFNGVCGATCQLLRKQNRNGPVNYMRLKLILPVVDAEKYKKPETCPYGCGGKEFWIRQEVKKLVRDSSQREVLVRRYECLNCRRTFRVYPQGINHKQFSQRAIGLVVML